ncbi:uncharacterized protein LOC109950157 [Prunus persica]|uniref:uncharacterized protein LOC109950157 n=1 Tax=Prunus persica TaxID=3760 RepID=UPI0009AB93D2|nr:uncharacterized protein LOC109950157 [Prunus persica]
MKLTSLNMQKDISTEIIKAIIREIGDSLFAILVDESCDMSSKEQMAIVLRYVDKGQLALVAVAKKYSEIVDLFTMVSNVVNVVGASAKRRDMLREKHADVIFEALNNNELLSGQGLNQETNLKRSSDTRWSSHYNCLINLENMFPSVLDVLKILRELNDWFNEKNTELLLCMACLSPSNSFFAFDKAKLMPLAQFYPSDFSEHVLKLLEEQLENYIWDVSSNNEFTELKGITDLAQKMVETKKDQIYPLVYLLLTLALILPVATTSVERVFSVMNIVKNRLLNQMGDLWMNDCLVAYIENDIFNSIDDEVVM